VAVLRKMLVLEQPTLEAWEALGADGAPLGAVSVEVDGAGPQPGDDVEGSL
jgi:hypothetical protein